MGRQELDRRRFLSQPLADRENRVQIERDAVPLDAEPLGLSKQATDTIHGTVERIVRARRNGRSVMLTFGAHAIKNGMGLVLRRLIEDGWVTHLATNGAGVIHDWEIAFQGATSEDVRGNMDRGQFGAWQETGYYINLALAVGAYEGLGYGEAVGKMIQSDGLHIPDVSELVGTVQQVRTDPDKSAAAADLLATMKNQSIAAGDLRIPHPFKDYSIQAAAYRLGVPFTGHPMIGQDIIYNHPANTGGAVGRTGVRDYLSFADSVSRIDGGVYLSVGSAVMSPMVFEKAMALCQNIRVQAGGRMEGHSIVVVDLVQAGDGWSGSGEPPASSAAYYQRHMKTFSRMGGEMRYLCADGRDVLLALSQALGKQRRD
ncbi:MAG: hypothetical protein WCL44_04315 [bacterium]